jgi:hypothetical protein
VTEPSSPSAGSGSEPFRVDTTVAHAARIYDYLLGGTDHFEVDREAAEHAFALYPGGSDAARINVRTQRVFIGDVVRYLAGEAGVRQFLDIGTGIPNADNVHAVAQQTAPESRIVYVDYDPVVLAHAQTLLRSTPEGATTYIAGDVRAPDKILQDAAETLDFTRPTAVILVGLLHLIRDEEDPYGIVARLLAAVPSGSYLVIAQMAKDIQPEAMAELTERLSQTMEEPFVPRTRTEVSRFFDGLKMVNPGVIQIEQWHPHETKPAPPAGTEIPIHVGVGYKP